MSSAQSRRRIPAERWKNIRLFAMDVDGILTDGSLFIGSDGVESKLFSVLDGLGLGRLHEAGIILAWISGRASGATEARARELLIPHLMQNRKDKLEALKELAAERKLRRSSICYMGDDDIDAAALRWAGIGVTVPEAQQAALAAADMITRRSGGRGAVREVSEQILAFRGRKQK